MPEEQDIRISPLPYPQHHATDRTAIGWRGSMDSDSHSRSLPQVLAFPFRAKSPNRPREIELAGLGFRHHAEEIPAW